VSAGSAAGGCLTALRNRLAFALLTLAFSFLAMGLSFFVVRWLIAGMDDEVPIDPAVQHRAILLRGFANELTRACNDYHRFVVQSGPAVEKDARAWIDRVFRRDIHFLEQQLNDNPMSTLPVYVGLRAAVQRCAVMARNPDDGGLRRATFREARAAIEATNGYLADIGMAHSAGRAPRRIAFD